MTVAKLSLPAFSREACACLRYYLPSIDGAR